MPQGYPTAWGCVHVNDAIERTRRLTGMPRDEIVRRGLVRGEIPIYGLGGLALGGTIAGACSRR